VHSGNIRGRMRTDGAHYAVIEGAVADVIASTVGATSPADSVSSLATRASSYPSASQTPPGGPEPGSAAQLPKAVVHLHNAGHQRPLDLVRCPASPGQQPHPAALILRGNAPTTICARRSPSTRATRCLAKPSPGWQPHSAAIIFCGSSPTITNLRQHAVLYHACVTVIGEAEKVTHSFHCRNSLSLQGASHATST
jgi:hypothetical protein